MDDLTFYRYELNNRSGIIVQGPKGFGEIAPLPGYSQETLDDAIVAIKKGDYSLPSVSFGIESAHFNIIEPHAIRIHCLLQGNKKQIFEQADRFFEMGFQVAKLKLRDLTFIEAKEVILAIKAHFTLRVDLNRQWPLKVALDFFSQFEKEVFEYIEEPLENPHDLAFFPYPIALDESYREGFDFPHVKTLIIKPTLTRAIPKNRPVILSSTFESEIGIWQIANLVRRLNLQDYIHGLGTFLFHTESLIEEKLHVSNGFLHLPATITPKMKYLHAL